MRASPHSLHRRIAALEARAAAVAGRESLTELVEASIQLVLELKAMSPEQRAAYEVRAAESMRAWLAGPPPAGNLTRLIWEAARVGQEFEARHRLTELEPHNRRDDQ